MMLTIIMLYLLSPEKWGLTSIHHKFSFCHKGNLPALAFGRIFYLPRCWLIISCQTRNTRGFLIPLHDVSREALHWSLIQKMRRCESLPNGCKYKFKHPSLQLSILSNFILSDVLSTRFGLQTGF